MPQCKAPDGAVRWHPRDTSMKVPARPAGAGWLLPMIGFVPVGGMLAAIINAVIGAVILLIVVGFFKK